jgi:hypothetical protein
MCELAKRRPYLVRTNVWGRECAPDGHVRLFLTGAAPGSQQQLTATYETAGMTCSP